MVLFWLKMLGAGDIKLLSVLYVHMGIRIGTVCLIISFILNAIAALFKLLYYHNLLSRLQYLANYISKSITKKERIRYYDEAQGMEPVIHFSIGILMSVLIWGEMVR